MEPSIVWPNEEADKGDCVLTKSVITQKEKAEIQSLRNELHKICSAEEISGNNVGKQLVPAQVTEDMNRELLKEYSAQEVKLALSQMFPFKSGGPDGMPPVFYQRFWNIVGRSTLNLRNLIYKLVSKTIANRLKPHLNSIILPFQSAFILGRLITDNVLVAFKVNHFLKNKRGGKEGSVAIKLDMSKAYEMIEWGFMKRILLKMGFHTCIVKMIMSFVSSVSYSFMLNGSQFGYLKPGRGIRQGDLLSPYLFIICAKALNCLLQFYEIKGSIRGVAVARSAPKTTTRYTGLPELCGGKKAGGLRFRDLRAFNLAMLAKQGWRIFKNPNLLLSRILKAMYFSRSELFDAQVGYNVSYTWRNILEARPILEDGIR
ncbi:hypothetical protein Sango_0803900 [Sesamum angolense]|uniref:Reverse transcriptase domain-containing protein n=1 Tax=Sesamum angolense TaxID=2727404 RepID=A0AAE1X3S9_9LAMI|nr:hypothetical protein Sango_0803900 [Sesamum angolense]